MEWKILTRSFLAYAKFFASNSTDPQTSETPFGKISLNLMPIHCQNHRCRSLANARSRLHYSAARLPRHISRNALAPVIIIIIIPFYSRR
jgi:hypothetical protein